MKGEETMSEKFNYAHELVYFLHEIKIWIMKHRGPIEWHLTFNQDPNLLKDTYLKY